MNTTHLLESTLKGLFPILANITDYKVKHLPSLRKTIDPFSPKETYEEVLDFIQYQEIPIHTLESYLNGFISDNINISYRLKSGQSFLSKWSKNLGKHKQLREVCNDVIGIRFIVDLSRNEMESVLLKIIKSVGYTIDIINFYEKPKAVDDGYRGMHLYFRDNPKCFP